MTFAWYQATSTAFKEASLTLYKMTPLCFSFCLSNSQNFKLIDSGNRITLNSSYMKNDRCYQTQWGSFTEYLYVLYSYDLFYTYFTCSVLNAM